MKGAGFVLSGEQRPEDLRIKVHDRRIDADADADAVHTIRFRAATEERKSVTHNR
jgi:hypothetical protein